jgi:hypothetical protein
MNKKKRQTTQLNLLIRCIVAAYLIYLAHSIIKELDTAPNVRLMVLFAIAFTFAGVLIIAFAIRAFINREYVDFRDQGDEEEPDEGPDNIGNASDSPKTDEEQQSKEN